MDLKFFIYTKEGNVYNIGSFSYNEFLEDGIIDKIFDVVINDYAQKHGLCASGTYLYDEEECEAVGCFFLVKNNNWKELMAECETLIDDRNVPDEVFHFSDMICKYAEKFVN